MNPDCWTLYKTAGPICRGHEIHTGAGGRREEHREKQTVQLLNRAGGHMYTGIHWIAFQ